MIISAAVMINAELGPEGLQHVAVIQHPKSKTAAQPCSVTCFRLSRICISDTLAIKGSSWIHDWILFGTPGGSQRPIAYENSNFSAVMMTLCDDSTAKPRSYLFHLGSIVRTKLRRWQRNSIAVWSLHRCVPCARASFGHQNPVR